METINIPSAYLIIVTIALFSTILIAALVILKALKTIIKVTMPDLEKEEVVLSASDSTKKLQRKERWNKILGLNPLDKEQFLESTSPVNWVRPDFDNSN